MKILSITEKVPKEVTLEDGSYLGIWGGYNITVNFKDKVYELKTEEGVRGIGIRALVTVKNSIATFEELKN